MFLKTDGSPFFRRLALVVLRLRWPILFGFVVMTALFGYATTTLKIDPSTDSLFAKNTPEYQFYKEFRDHFGSDYLVAVAIETSNYFKLSNLRFTHVLTRLLSSDPRVDRVVSLTNVLDVKHKTLGVKIEPAIAGVFEGEKPIEVFREEALSNPFIQGNLLSRDGKVGAVLLRLKTKSDNPDFLRGYISDLRKILNVFSWPGAKFYVAGSPVEQHDFVATIRRDQMFFIPAVTLLLILATYLIYRNLASVVVAMSIVFVTLFWTFGTIALLGHALNLVNSLLAPVVMIISVTNAIYMINLFSEIRPHHPSLRESTCLTVEYLGLPCLLAMGTIVAGFLSLYPNPVPAVQSFGLFASLGAFYAYVVAILLTPLLLPLLPFRRRLKQEEENHFFNRAVIFYLERVEFHWKWVILTVTLFLVVMSVIGMKKIRMDTNLIRDLPPSSPLAIATRFIDDHLAGVYSLGLSIEKKDHGSLVDVDTLKRMDALAQFMESQPEITKVNSLATLVKKIQQARENDPSGFKIPDSERALKRYIKGMVETNNPDLLGFISRDLKHMRMEARMKAVGTEKGRELEDRIWGYVKKNWGEDYQIRITGNVVLLGRMSESLVSNQIQSVGLAFFIILILISLFLRSWKLGLLAAVPNLIPVVGLYGLMGFSKIELSTPTAMISSVVLGLVADASIHFLYRFRYEFEKRKHYLQALHHTYRNMGQAMVVSTMILVLGFASSIFASFRPTIFFGLLTSLTILFALICTLVLLPIVLTILKPLGRQELWGRPSKQTLTPAKPSSIISD